MQSGVFFFNDTATTEIYTLSLHDALPIYHRDVDHGKAVEHGVEDTPDRSGGSVDRQRHRRGTVFQDRDRKSTRLNSSHANISYAVFCLKKQKLSPALRAGLGWSPHHFVSL